MTSLEIAIAVAQLAIADTVTALVGATRWLADGLLMGLTEAIGPEAAERFVAALPPAMVYGILSSLVVSGVSIAAYLCLGPIDLKSFFPSAMELTVFVLGVSFRIAVLGLLAALAKDGTTTDWLDRSAQVAFSVAAGFVFMCIMEFVIVLRGQSQRR